MKVSELTAHISIPKWVTFYANCLYFFAWMNQVEVKEGLIEKLILKHVKVKIL